MAQPEQHPSLTNEYCFLAVKAKEWLTCMVGMVNSHNDRSNGGRAISSCIDRLSKRYCTERISFDEEWLAKSD